MIMPDAQYDYFPDNEALALNSFGSKLNVAIVGVMGGLGRAFVEALMPLSTVLNIFCFSRSNIRI